MVELITYYNAVDCYRKTGISMYLNVFQCISMYLYQCIWYQCISVSPTKLPLKVAIPRLCWTQYGYLHFSVLSTPLDLYYTTKDTGNMFPFCTPFVNIRKYKLRPSAELIKNSPKQRDGEL